jgi:hypothetical protein
VKFSVRREPQTPRQRGHHLQIRYPGLSTLSTSIALICATSRFESEGMRPGAKLPFTSTAKTWSLGVSKMRRGLRHGLRRLLRPRFRPLTVEYAVLTLRQDRGQRVITYCAADTTPQSRNGRHRARSRAHPTPGATASGQFRCRAGTP